MYGLDKSVKSFAIANDFVINTNKACYQLGSHLMPFCIYSSDKQKEYNVTDIATFSGMLDSSIPLVEEIAKERIKAYKDFGMNLSEDMQKALVYDYFLSISVCYVEVPKWVTKMGVSQETYDKFLCTKNPAIVAAWMGMDKSVMQAKYTSRVQSRQIEFQEGEIRFVKLSQSAKGNTVSVPRQAYSVENMTCIPMYMLYAFIEGFKTVLNDNIIGFSYLKDNGTVRELASTLSEDILRKYYDDTMFIAQMLQVVDINTVQQGGMQLSSKMNRGYIKIPEVGASIYDGTGVRSLNIARILDMKILQDIDTSFINVDLNSVVANFGDAVDYLLKTSPESIKDCYQTLTGDIAGDNPVLVSQSLKDYAQSRSTFLSTTFHRQLHKFMINNPAWFPLYTGMPNKSIVSSDNSGIMPMEW